MQYIDRAGKQFLPTPSARRATGGFLDNLGLFKDFYPRPPRGGRHVVDVGSDTVLENFYPRHPRGGRPASPPCWSRPPKFLPTPSARRATGLYDAITSSFVRFLPTPSARRATSKCAIKQKLFSGSICTMRYSPRKKRAVFVQAALSLERSLHV